MEVGAPRRGGGGAPGNRGHRHRTRFFAFCRIVDAWAAVRRAALGCFGAVRRCGCFGCCGVAGQLPACTARGVGQSDGRSSRGVARRSSVGLGESSGYCSVRVESGCDQPTRCRRMFGAHAPHHLRARHIARGRAGCRTDATRRRACLQRAGSLDVRRRH